MAHDKMQWICVEQEKTSVCLRGTRQNAMDLRVARYNFSMFAWGTTKRSGIACSKIELQYACVAQDKMFACSMITLQYVCVAEDKMQ